MTRLFASAAYRIAFVYAAIFALTISVLGAAVYLAADREIGRQQDENIRIETAELMDEIHRKSLNELLTTITARQNMGGLNAFLYGIYAPGGSRRAGTLPAPSPPLGWRWIMLPTGQTRLLVSDIGKGWRLAVAVDGDAVAEIQQIILELTLAAIGIALIVGIAGAIFLGGYLRARLETVGETAQAIASGDLTRRIPVSSRGDEFDRLGRGLNAMLDRIAQLLENLRQVSSDVAHDLRTPLARLRGEVELALGTGEGPADPVVQRAALERALRQSDDLLRLFAAILRISEVEGGALKRSFTNVDVSSLVADLYDAYAPAVTDEGRSMESQVADDLIVVGDRELIAQALINLLDNAQRHTPLGTHIALSATRGRNGDVELVVADNGPGVPEKDRERVVRRFVRLDPSRGEGGHGLGLNLVSAIAHVHGGKLIIGDNAPGLAATLRLPAPGTQIHG
ncbi:HAMP domain-containing sensor histidine kinase [Sphingomonas sp.]|uniref:sensor histidine kinase n=1 Tax=Sphingomonas sp. TaxID=28214 RepID=UPI001E05C77A|nr:HAMP domain-containing sensor histidine kinase [Sphingomonas sp.]MBX9796800.1 HAMP domain-containing histidine kinase [Sphingomonas sp.]